ncbi:hypothetical protein Dda_9016 [Drechslerella dactyloides]|uniref:Copper transport protein 86 n=1 Tax=Drechslerella dactyloides TaxID=74499 RepID=A0AAD6NEM5_DREDA|nr:hypothetical protein Dda_9016 [Drechslerella dactyloides]
MGTTTTTATPTATKMSTSIHLPRRASLANSLVRLVLLLSAQIPTLASYPLSGRSRRDLLNVWDDEGHDGHGVEGDTDEPQFWVYLGVSVFLVVLGGVFAGLTLGLMGQDEIYLQVIAQSGEDKEQRHARQVLRLLTRGKHWVLVTLLLGNVITNETLPIVLDRSLGGGWPAVLSSTVLIVIFGEIIPQSVCVRYGLSIGAYLSPFVLFLMYIMFPVAYPTAMLLDWILGEDHGTTYKKAGLKTLVTLHKTLGEHPAERLNQDEVTIITAVLDLKDKPVGIVMTPMQDVFTMSADMVLDEKMMDMILRKGYSRIPIHAPGEPTNFVGMLLVKILITYDPEDAMKVADFPLATLPETAPETSCLDIVNFFQEGKSHMVLVSENPGENYGALGVITLEDVIEELIGEEIVDESDVYVDVHKAIRRMNPGPITRRVYGANLPSDSGRNSQVDDIIASMDSQKVAGELDKILPGEVGERPPITGGLRRASTSIIADEQSPRRGSRASMTHAVLRKLSTGSGIPESLKESLKHLGPSNPAAAPRQTGLKTIKIKNVHTNEGDSPTALRERRTISFREEMLKGKGSSNTVSRPDLTQSQSTSSMKVPEREVQRSPSPITSYKKARSGSLKERPKEVGGIRKVIVEALDGDEEAEAELAAAAVAASSPSPPANGKKDDEDPDEPCFGCTSHKPNSHATDRPTSRSIYVPYRSLRCKDAMTQLQFLPELLLAVLFSIQASFTHPGVLSPDKEKLGDDELRAIVKRTQTSSEAREVLAFSARVWAAMTETLRSGCDELSGCEHHFDSPAATPTAAGVTNASSGGGNSGGAVVSAAAVSAAGVGAGVGTSAAGAAAGAAAAAASGGGSSNGNGTVTTTGRKANGVGEQTCTCKDRRDKMYLLPKVWELVILGRNLLATKEKGQDLAAESKFEEEVRRLCEICVKHAEKESYHKVLITCLQFLNNLISGNEKRKMSLWMHLFVPGSTRLLEAAKRKAVKQYQANSKDPSSSPSSSADPKKKPPVDLISFAKDIHQEVLKAPQASSPGSQAKLSFVTMLPTILSAKEMLPLLLIIHGSITDIDGTDPARQLMRCKMMLAAEAGIGLMAGLLMFVDAWHEIDDHIYFELILEIMETILHNGLITYLFETLKEYVDCRNYQFEGIHAITPPQAVILRLLHTIYAPAALPTISEPGAYINYDGRIEDSVKYPPPPGLLPPIVPGEYELPSPSKIIHGYKPGGGTTAVPAPPDEDGDMDPFTAEFTAALRSDLGPLGGEEGSSKDRNNAKGDEEPAAEDDAATEVDIDHSEATPEIVNFLAVKVLKGQLGPAVRDMVTKIGRATGYCAGSPFSFDTSTIAPTIPPPPVASAKAKGAATPADRVLEIKEIPTEDGRWITSVAGITIYDVELHYEGLIQLLELLMLFAEQSMGRVYLRETRCIDELIAILQTMEMFVPRTTPKDRATAKKNTFSPSPYTAAAVPASGFASVGGGAAAAAPSATAVPAGGAVPVAAEDEEDSGMECNDPAEFRWPLIKRTIVQIIGLLAYRNKETQDQIRKNGGLIAIISCFNIDEENPYIPQHATLCVRNLLEGNAENQRIVWTLEAREVMNTRDLEKAGLQAYVDKQGKVKVGAAPGSQGPVQAAAAAAAATQAAAASASNSNGGAAAAGGSNNNGGGSKKKKKGKK